MPTLVIDNVPVALYQRLQHLAEARKQTPADTVLEVLASALNTVTPMASEPPPPSEIFLPTEISAPFTIPRPEGTPVVAKWIADYLPEPHDVPDEE
jgi:hypothetical protein